MRYNVSIVLALSLLVSGCTVYLPSGRTRSNAKPVTIYKEAAEPAAEAPAGTAKPPQEEAAAPAPPVVRPEEKKAAAPEVEPALEKSELSVQYLTALLEARETRTAAEEEAYRRLLGVMPEGAPRSEDTDVYALLGRARDFILKGDHESARRNASEALVTLRRRTDPAIEAVYFASEVLSYGNAARIAAPEFKAGQRVLLVTDLSSFACESVGSASPPALYRTRMSQRVAIYDAEGKLVFQRSFDSLEYQSAHYVSTMFIPLKFQLPSNMRPGTYTAKVEVVDEIAGRQNDAGVDFTVR